jgi:hypothetical protein
LKGRAAFDPGHDARAFTKIGLCDLSLEAFGQQMIRNSYCVGNDSQ